MPTKRQEFCKRGHRIDDDPYIFPNGKRVCRRCRQIWKRESGNKQRVYVGQPGLVPTGGLPWPQAWAKYLMVLRRIYYGTEPTAAQIASGKQLAARYATPNLFNTHCKRGHEYAKDDNLAWTASGHRRCRSCDRIRQGGVRPLWVKVDGVRISVRTHDAYYLREWRKLRKVMIASHPDHGGTVTKFRKARRQEQTFLKREGAWYAQYNVAPPRLGRLNLAWSDEARQRAATAEAQAVRAAATRKGWETRRNTSRRVSA